jgi:predicted permease
MVALTVNLASLLLARATQREKEVAVSRALGANALAVIRAMVVEGTVLGALGGVGGAITGFWGVKLLVSLAPLELPRRETIALDWRIALVVIAVGTVAGFIAACIPAGWAAKVSLDSLLSAASVRGAGRAGRMRRLMIVAQVAVSLIMLSAGGLIVRSFETLLRADPGFRPEGVFTAGISVGPRIFPKIQDEIAFQDRVESALSELPGVTQVSGVSALPLSAAADGPIDVLLPGAPGNTSDPAKDGPNVDVMTSRPGYVQAMGMRLVAGHDFDPSQRQNLNEVLIDRHLAQQFYPGSSPVGATLILNKQPLTIVGVVDQARLYALYKEGRPQIFLRQNESYPYAPYLVVRTSRDPRSMISGLNALIRRIDPRVAVSNARTMDDIVTDALRQQRISMLLITGFALGALLLLLMGLFGLISGSVARRRGELAVRMALGATQGSVITLVVSEGAQLLAIGSLLGLPGIYVAGRVMRGLLIGISPFDPRTLAEVAAAFVLLALTACYLAGRRVTGIAPERLLRGGG